MGRVGAGTGDGEHTEKDPAGAAAPPDRPPAEDALVAPPPWAAPLRLVCDLACGEEAREEIGGLPRRLANAVRTAALALEGTATDPDALRARSHGWDDRAPFASIAPELGVVDAALERVFVELPEEASAAMADEALDDEALSELLGEEAAREVDAVTSAPGFGLLAVDLVTEEQARRALRDLPGQQRGAIKRAVRALLDSRAYASALRDRLEATSHLKNTPPIDLGSLDAREMADELDALEEVLRCLYDGGFPEDVIAGLGDLHELAQSLMPDLNRLAARGEI